MENLKEYDVQDPKRIFTITVPKEDERNKKRAKFYALTGGPKGGKTMTLNPAVEALKAEGFIVLSYDETATEYISNKYYPTASTHNGEVSLYDFQEGITTSQVIKEVMARRKANQFLQISDRVAVIYDRAVPDGGVYVDRETFDRILSSVTTCTLEDFIDSYDLVIHFVSTAKDKPEVFLEVQEGQERIEDDIRETIEKEDRTREMYPEGPKKLVLGNDCTFEEKQATAISALIADAKKDAKTIVIKEKNMELLRKMRKSKTTDANGQKRVILYDNGHTYILGRYQDGSKMTTLEMMPGAPVPSWVLDYEELLVEPNKAYIKNQQHN